MNEYIWVGLVILFLGIGVGVGIDIGNDEIDEISCPDTWCDVYYEERLFYMNRTDKCIEEVFEVIDEGEVMKRKIYEYINYK